MSSPIGNRSFSSEAQRVRSLDFASRISFFSPVLDAACPAIAGSRKRLYTTMFVFWLFLSQVLEHNTSCRESVRKALAWLASGCKPAASGNTAAYCKARKRLPLEWLESILVATRTPKGSDWCWKGRRAIVVDGTSSQLPDTPENQEQWPQPKTQKPGCGFPVVHILAAFNLASGCLEHYIIDKLYTSERAMFLKLRTCLKKGDVVLADRGLCGFAEMYELAKAGIDAVMRKHQRLSVSLKTLRRINKSERIAAWHRTNVPSQGYTREEWNALPETITVREVDVVIDEPGFRTKSYTLLTTLLDTERYIGSDFAQLYHRRWQVELHFDEIKTAMGMKELHCKSPAMVERELLMFLIAYNLIRLTMLKAAQKHKVSVERISFTGTLDTLVQWSRGRETSSTAKLKQDWKAMLDIIARDLVPDRPGRREPRVTKHKQGTYAILTSPRHEFQENPHRNRYKKENNGRTTQATQS